MSGRSSILLAALEPRALNVEGGAAPEWIELIPAGPVVQGIDGRSWGMIDAAQVVAATKAANRPIPLDWEHATEVRAPKGEEAPAAGWLDDFEVRAGAIWGHVAWTPRAANQVIAKEYRFVSPVFTYGRAAPFPIGRICNVALTNTPNLTLTALNRAGEQNRESPEDTLDLAKLRTALGLAADASDDAIIAAATEAKAANRTVDLTSYAPRSDLDAALNRATTAEGDLTTLKAAGQEAKITAALDKAQAEGKITPASRPEYLAMCKSAGGLESFERLAATLPKIAGAEDTKAGEKPRGDGAISVANLTDEQRAVCRATGKDEAEFVKSLQTEKAA